MIDLIPKDFRLLARALSWKTGIALALAVSVSLTEGVGLVMLVPLLHLIGVDAPGGTLDRIGGLVSNGFALAGLRPSALPVLGLYVLIVGARALLVRRQNIENVLFQHDTVSNLRKQLYGAIANAGWVFLARSRSSELMHALTVEAERAGTAVYYLLSMLRLSAVTMIYVLFALKISAAMTGLALICGTVLALLLRRRSLTTRRLGEEISESSSALYAAMTEGLNGLKTVKSYGAEKRAVAAFAGLTERMRSACSAAIRNQADASALFEVGSVIGLALALFISLRFVRISGPEIMVLLFLFSRLMPRFSNLHQNYQGLLNALPAFGAVMDIQKRCMEAAESEIAVSHAWRVRREIRLENVTFSYEKDRPPAVRNIDLSIRGGETTALVGISGAGKTTIADLVSGLITPDSGRVLLDGAPLTAADARSWRENIAYVPQDTFLFHDTVRANLLWARPSAGQKQIGEALRLAGAEEFVARLRYGLDSVIGDRGLLLSGGEKQRLALARALLREPELLILDEATSALDSESENRIHQAIDGLRGRLTILLITHRLSTLHRADRIHVIEAGRSGESGTWDGLFENSNGTFRKLCIVQGVSSGLHQTTPIGAIRLDSDVSQAVAGNGCSL